MMIKVHIKKISIEKLDVQTNWKRKQLHALKILGILVLVDYILDIILPYLNSINNLRVWGFQIMAFFGEGRKTVPLCLSGYFCLFCTLNLAQQLSPNSDYAEYLYSKYK